MEIHTFMNKYIICKIYVCICFLELSFLKHRNGSAKVVISLNSLTPYALLNKQVYFMLVFWVMHY